MLIKRLLAAFVALTVYTTTFLLGLSTVTVSAQTSCYGNPACSQTWNFGDPLFPSRWTHNWAYWDMNKASFAAEDPDNPLQEWIDVHKDAETQWNDTSNVHLIEVGGGGQISSAMLSGPRYGQDRGDIRANGSTRIILQLDSSGQYVYCGEFAFKCISKIRIRINGIKTWHGDDVCSVYDFLNVSMKRTTVHEFGHTMALKETFTDTVLPTLSAMEWPTVSEQYLICGNVVKPADALATRYLYGP